MKDNGELHNIEKAIGDSMRKDISCSAPPFAEITRRIAAGEPRESFDEFFAEEMMPAPVQSAKNQKNARWRILAGAAAALVLVAGGGAMLAAILNGSLIGAKSAADATEGAMYYECIDNNERKSAENAVAEDSECMNDNVSDSDMEESEKSESSDSSR